MYGNPNNNMFFNVNGYEGALQFSCLPNQTVLLLDTQNPYLYMKQANQMGQATIKTFLLKEMENNPDRQREIVLMIEDILDFAEKKNSRFYSALMEKIRETQVTKTKR